MNYQPRIADILTVIFGLNRDCFSYFSLRVRVELTSTIR